MKWYNVAVPNGDWCYLKEFLVIHGYKYEPSECADWTHVEVYTDSTGADKLDNYLDCLFDNMFNEY